MNVIESLYDDVQVSYSEINEGMYLWHSVIHGEFRETLSGSACVLVILNQWFYIELAAEWY